MALLVVGIGTEDVHAALAADDLAIFAAAANGWVNLHGVSFNFFLGSFLICRVQASR